MQLLPFTALSWGEKHLGLQTAKPCDSHYPKYLSLYPEEELGMLLPNPKSISEEKKLDSKNPS